VTPEGIVKQHIDKRLKVLLAETPHWLFKPVQRGLGMPALDYLICINGRFFAIEAKPLGKYPTPRQLATIAEITASGGKVLVIIGVEQADTFTL